MAFLVKEDLKTHLYAEVIEEISREDDSVIEQCISDAIAEVKGYLSRFDRLSIFGNATVDPVITDDALRYAQNLVKDVACWHIVRLANPNINVQLFREAYDDVLKVLEKIQKGIIDPEGWLYPVDDPETPQDESSTVQWSSNTKRSNHF